MTIDNASLATESQSPNNIQPEARPEFVVEMQDGSGLSIDRGCRLFIRSHNDAPWRAVTLLASLDWFTRMSGGSAFAQGKGWQRWLMQIACAVNGTPFTQG